MTPRPVQLLADTCLVAGDRILLIRFDTKTIPDREPGWYLPVDELSDFEPPDQAAIRSLFEQTGVETSGPFLSHVESSKGRHAQWRLAFHYVVQLAAPPPLTTGAGVTEARWFDLTKLPPRGDVANSGRALTTIKEILQRAAG
ncbi:MAG: NUDIX domain-containing protein [Candidatus Eisenbacteria bacterium]|nr:NUDIX domain-containing protein [Candidatus Eisenbacteria bacterium]